MLALQQQYRTQKIIKQHSGVTSHWQPGNAGGPKTVKGAQSDPNYVSRLLLDCVPVFHKIITLAYLLYRLTVSMAYTVH